jgi:branched-chain amino acid transport system ATP-binding protein
MDGALLSCSELSVGYGKVVVARDIELSVAPNQILAVLGPNGAGKTTLLRTFAGLLRPQLGAISLDGDPVKRISARRMNAAGIVLVPDSRALFTELTPLENLSLAAKRGSGKRAATVDEVLDLFPQLRTRSRVRTGMLSGGEQQMLAVARALVQRPRVLLIDEMSMGLAPVIVESLMPLVRQVADETGAAIILVEQHVHLALEVADDAMVLVHGEVTLTGSAVDLLSRSSALESAYLGERVDAATEA